MIIPPWVYAGAGLLAVAGGFGAGYYLRDLQCDNAAMKKELKTVDDIEAAQDVVDEKATQFEEEREDAQVQHNTRTETIRTIYRDRNIEVPASCEPPDVILGVLNDARRAANAAASGKPGSELRGSPAAP